MLRIATLTTLVHANFHHEAPLLLSKHELLQIYLASRLRWNSTNAPRELTFVLHLLETLLRSRHRLNRSVVTQRKEQKCLARQKIGVLFLIVFPSWQPTKAKAKTQ